MESHSRCFKENVRNVMVHNAQYTLLNNLDERNSTLNKHPHPPSTYHFRLKTNYKSFSTLNFIIR